MFPMVIDLQHAQAGSSTAEDRFSFIVALLTLHGYVTSLCASLTSTYYYVSAGPNILFCNLQLGVQPNPNNEESRITKELHLRPTFR